MLQITLDSTGQQSAIQSTASHNWGFKLRVVNEGNSTELRLSFDESSDVSRKDLLNNIIPVDDNNKPLND